MIEILNKVHVLDLVKDYVKLSNGIEWTDYGNKGKQCGLQYQQEENSWTSAVGRSKGAELNYTNLNPYFKDSVFATIIDQYKLLRTRLIWVGPYACYSMHRDSTPRIHIPIITNPDCYFVFKDSVPVHMRSGYVYHTDTRKTHTFMNCSASARLHLVGVVEE